MYHAVEKSIEKKVPKFYVIGSEYFMKQNAIKPHSKIRNE
jgi:hypothetical protein